MEYEIIQMQVGKTFPIEKVVKHFKGTNGGGSLDYIKDDKTVSLYCGIPSPRSREIRSFNTGLIRFAVYENKELDTALLLIHFGTDLVFDLVFDINVLDEDMDGIVEGNAFHMYLIDARTGILKGMRSLGLGEGFMKELNRITKNDGRYTSEQYNAWIRETYQYDLPTLWRKSRRIDWDK